MTETTLLESLQSLQGVKGRAAAALVGAAVADAAARPLHWIYDEERLKEILEDKVPRDNKHIVVS